MHHVHTWGIRTVEMASPMPEAEARVRSEKILSPGFSGVKLKMYPARSLLSVH